VPPSPDAATTMEKLDAALNNMSHGLCMFGPDNRLLLWNVLKSKSPKVCCSRISNGALAILRRIKGLGVRIAMDDFGTGYSSLSYLQDFPFDKIKIDQTFISRIGDSFQAGAIIHAILRLGRTLALPVIAEGVETEEQRAFLAREGCQIQGYLIGRPEPIAHYQHLVAGLAGARENFAGGR
jgi:predicted signal transduction protein with EAL and GGDEF domain